MGEGEDLLAQFHPHRGSYLGRYAADAVWIVYGVIAWSVAKRTADSGWLGLLTLALLAIPMAALPRVRKEGVDVLALVWGGAAVVLIVSFWKRTPPVELPILALGLGIAAGLVGLLRTELSRQRHLTAVTNRRILLRGGLGRMVERTIELDRIDSVRAVQNGSGQMFHYADLVLTLEGRSRAKAGAVAPHETIHGVPDWQRVKHRLESVMEERRLTPKQREKAAEERRLKDSMHALAGWAGREGETR